MNKRIAIIGLSSNKKFAPYKDSSWSKWIFNHRPNLHPSFDLHFDIHNTTRYSVDHPYYNFLINNKNKSILNGYDLRFKDCLVYPKEYMIAKYGNQFLTSSVAWLLAYAIERVPDDIGLWGIECSSNEEYIKQKAGIFFFLGVAYQRGIKLHFPMKCDLFNKEDFYYNC